jgi:hypothetical protein
LIRFADGAEEKFEDYRISYLHTVAVGKLPFELVERTWTLWPALGLQFDYNLRYEYDGVKQGDVNHEPHDVYALGGVGTDYLLGSTLLTESLLAGYGSTPSLGSSVSEDASGLKASVAIGVLFGL